MPDLRGLDSGGVRVTTAEIARQVLKFCGRARQGRRRLVELAARAFGSARAFTLLALFRDVQFAKEAFTSVHGALISVLITSA
jgi:hypothetical protein